MQVIKWNPMRNRFGLGHGMNSLFDNFFLPMRKDEWEESFWSWNPKVDIYDEDDHIVLKAELPGVEKSDIAVDIKDRVLTLKGERSADNKVEKDNYYRQERSYGRFERSFTLPGEVNTEDIKAEYKDGLLKIDIPKPEKDQPKQITVH